MNHWGWAVYVAAAVVVSAVGATPADAGETRFERMLLVRSGDRVSLVFELTSEPRDVSTRRVSNAVLEVEIGPAVMPPAGESYVAPPDVRFLRHVSIARAGRRPDGGSLTARITLMERSRSLVRIVGRRVYVDFSGDERTDVGRQPPARATVTVAAPARVPVPEPLAPPPPLDTYKTAIAPSLAKFEQLAPFLVSGCETPTAPVLKALGDTLATIAQGVGAVEVPQESREIHQLIASAVASASAAVDPSFGGDRARQVRQALALVDQAKASL
jgi:hypothetical protein